MELVFTPFGEAEKCMEKEYVVDDDDDEGRDPSARCEG